MTEVELIEEVAMEANVSTYLVAMILKHTKLVARKTLDAGEGVVLTGFGSFKVEKLQKKPLFGKPREEGFWVKVKFHPSRRPLHGEVRRSSRRRKGEDSGTGP